MLTPLTQTAIALLNDIACREISSPLTQDAHSQDTLETLLIKLESAGLIHLLAGKSRKEVLSFALSRSYTEISLLDVLEAIGEPWDCSSKIEEEAYERHGIAAHKLAMIHLIAQKFLSQIRVTELL